MPAAVFNDPKKGDFSWTYGGEESKEYGGRDPLVSAAGLRLDDVRIPVPAPNIPTFLNKEPEGEIWSHFLHTTLTMTQHVALGCVSTSNGPASRFGLSICYHSESVHLLLHGERQRSRVGCTCLWLYVWSPLLCANVSKGEGNVCAFSGAGPLLPPALSLSSDGWGGHASNRCQASQKSPRGLEPESHLTKEAAPEAGGPEPVTSAYWERMGPSSEVRAGREQVLPGDRWMVFPCERWPLMGLT